MKNMKYLSLLAILGLLVGCTSDLTTEEVPQPPSVPEQKISHVVPVEQALEDLQGLLEAIDAPAEDGAVTRSGGIRRVKNVTTVSPEALSPGGTRSEATADVEVCSTSSISRTRRAMPFWGPTTGWSRSMRLSMKEASRPKISGMP